MDRIKELKSRIRKKKFVYKKVSSRATGMGGTDVKAEIFKISKNTLSKVGDVGWNTASYRGDESTVFNELKALGLISKKIQKAKKKTGRENYYSWGDKEMYGLHIDEY